MTRVESAAKRRGSTSREGYALAAISEKMFTQQVRELAELLRWRFYHPWLSIHSPRGFPDVVLCRPPRVLLIELKTEKGKVSPMQEEWIALLKACPGVETYLWRPRDWPQIEEALR